VNFGTGAASFEARVASATNGGNIEIRLDSPTGKLVGTCTVTGTGGWQTWTTKSCPVSGAEGVHDLYFVFRVAAVFVQYRLVEVHSGKSGSNANTDAG